MPTRISGHHRSAIKKVRSEILMECLCTAGRHLGAGRLIENTTGSPLRSECVKSVLFSAGGTTFDSLGRKSLSLPTFFWCDFARSTLIIGYSTAKRSKMIAVGREAHLRMALLRHNDRPRRASQNQRWLVLRRPSGSKTASIHRFSVGALRDLRPPSEIPAGSKRCGS